MKLTELDSTPMLSALFSSQADVPRSVGLHVSTIIEALAESLGKGKSKPGKFTTDDLEGYRSMGFLWERVLEKILNEMMLGKGTVIRLSEICKDNIFMTPDGGMVTDNWNSLEEWKCTYTSSKRSVEDNFHWMTQIKAYCHALGVFRAHLRVLYVCGNWSPPLPCTKSYQLEFDRRELDENWQMLVNFAKQKGWL